MIPARQRGRRRAATARPFRYSPSRQTRTAGSIALVATALGMGVAPGLVAAAEGAPALQQAAFQTLPQVSAEATAQIAFDRTTVGTAAAPQGAVAAEPAPAAPAAPAPVSPAGLGNPLATMTLASSFGWRANPLGYGSDLHTGADFAAACGTAVFASAAGKVVEAGWHAYGGGNRIGIEHANGLTTTYNHLSTIGVTLGQTVAAGQTIGAAGTTGASTGCHLHFEVVKGGTTVDPLGFL